MSARAGSMPMLACRGRVSLIVRGLIDQGRYLSLALCHRRRYRRSALHRCYRQHRRILIGESIEVAPLIRLPVQSCARSLI